MGRSITEIILHCASTYPSMNIGAKEIRKWHVEERGWNDIGYHWVIRRDGTIDKGRSESLVGAHCLHHNQNTIGICLTGGLKEGTKQPEDNFTEAQFKSLAKLIKEIKERYPSIIKISGHSDYADKACPVFSVPKFIKEYL